MPQVLVTELLSEIAQITREAPSATMSLAYIRAARRLCNKSRWLVKGSAGVTVAGTSVYTLSPPDVYTEIIGVMAMSLTENATTINALTEDYSGCWNPNASESAPGVPGSYQYLPGGQVVLRVGPNGAYPLLASVVLQPLRNAVSLEVSLVTEWEYALQAGALSYLLGLTRTPWFDRNEAAVQEARFVGFMNQAQQSAARGYNAGAQLTDGYGSQSGAIHTRILAI